MVALRHYEFSKPDSRCPKTAVIYLGKDQFIKSQDYISLSRVQVLNEGICIDDELTQGAWQEK